jgi:PKD repeat protein
VTLTAYSSTNSDVATRTITVTKPVKLKIKAIKADVTRGNAPFTVRFSCDVSGNPTSSIWTINKETIKDDAIGRVTHAFTKAGVYDVTLVVKDATGHSDSMTNKGFITVLARVKPPVAYFSAKPTYGKASLTVKFMDKSKNNPTSWK